MSLQEEGPEPGRITRSQSLSGWSHFGRLQTQQATPGVRLHFDKVVANRPATSDGVIPIRWAGCLLYAMRNWGSVESKLGREVDAIVRFEAAADKRILKLANKVVRDAGSRVQEEVFDDIRSGTIE